MISEFLNDIFILFHLNSENWPWLWQSFRWAGNMIDAIWPLDDAIHTVSAEVAHFRTVYWLRVAADTTVSVLIWVQLCLSDRNIRPSLQVWSWTFLSLNNSNHNFLYKKTIFCLAVCMVRFWPVVRWIGCVVNCLARPSPCGMPSTWMCVPYQISMILLLSIVCMKYYY